MYNKNCDTHTFSSSICISITQAPTRIHTRMFWCHTQNKAWCKLTIAETDGRRWSSTSTNTLIYTSSNVLRRKYSFYCCSNYMTPSIMFYINKRQIRQKGGVSLGWKYLKFTFHHWWSIKTVTKSCGWTHSPPYRHVRHRHNVACLLFR